MTKQDALEVLATNRFTRQRLNEVMLTSLFEPFIALAYIESGEAREGRNVLMRWFVRNADVLEPMIQAQAARPVRGNDIDDWGTLHDLPPEIREQVALLMMKIANMEAEREATCSEDT